jgi:hypothetical protein
VVNVIAPHAHGYNIHRSLPRMRLVKSVLEISAFFVSSVVNFLSADSLATSR